MSLVCLVFPWSPTAQASLSVTIILTGYILQQRFAPFVTLSAIAGKLGVGADSAAEQLSRISSVMADLKARRRTTAVNAAAAAVDSHSSSSSVARRRTIGSLGRGSIISGGSSNGVQRGTDVDVVGSPVIVWHRGTGSDDNGGISVLEGATSMDSKAPVVADSDRAETAAVTTSDAAAQLQPTAHSGTVAVTHAALAATAGRLLCLRSLAQVVKAGVYMGLVDYNHLETSFLLASMAVLVSGMVFASDGMSPSLLAYVLLAASTIIIIVTSTTAFVGLLVFEVYRSFKFAALNDAVRAVEADRVVTSLTKSHKRRSGSGSASGVRGGKRLSTASSSAATLMHGDLQSDSDASIVARLGGGHGARRRSSLLQALPAAFTARLRRRFTQHEDSEGEGGSTGSSGGLADAAAAAVAEMGRELGGSSVSDATLAAVDSRGTAADESDLRTRSITTSSSYEGVPVAVPDRANRVRALR